MSDDGAPKSALELAMERLRKKDEEAGVTSQKLTEQQKAAIAEVRSLYDSKIAEQQILQEAALRKMLAVDPTERDEVTRQFLRERERLASERDNKLEKIRRGNS